MTGWFFSEKKNNKIVFLLKQNIYGNIYTVYARHVI